MAKFAGRRRAAAALWAIKGARGSGGGAGTPPDRVCVRLFRDGPIAVSPPSPGAERRRPNSLARRARSGAKSNPDRRGNAL